MKRQWRRRNYFIKKDLQGKYMFLSFILVLGATILFTVIFSLLSADTLTIVYKNYNLQIGRTPTVLLVAFLRAHWLFLVTGGVIVVAVAMFITHRIAGPLYRFEQSVLEMKRGNIGFDIRLRKGDEGSDLAGMINQFNGVLSARVKEMRELSGEIDRCVEQLSGAMTEGNSDAAASLARMKDATGRLKEILHSYVIKNE